MFVLFVPTPETTELQSHGTAPTRQVIKTKTNLRDLLSKGKTSKVVKGFTGKKGKFDAVLVLKEDMTIGFSFPWIEN
ncbi:hypothetical protein EfmAA94_12570 [Enterococcus faecium]|nr:hypothetical protein EfmAA94_12570 [Enterococcus faecium]